MRQVSGRSDFMLKTPTKQEMETFKKVMQVFGAKGGSVKSEKKRLAVTRNGFQPGWRKKLKKDVDSGNKP